MTERIKVRVTESLPEFQVDNVEMLQNSVLVSRYQRFCDELHERGVPLNEKEVFHYSPTANDTCLVGVATELAGNSEYGNGAYFAQHAIYNLALKQVMMGQGWQIPAEAEIELLWSRCALGRCKDFGPRCASRRGDKFARAKGLPLGLGPELNGEWPLEKRERRRAPPLDPTKGRSAGMYESVTGTEADLDFTQNSRLIDGPPSRQQGEPNEFGRQYVTFQNWQVYPQVKIRLSNISRPRPLPQPKRNPELEPEPEID